MIAICTDSSSLLTDAAATRLGVDVVPSRVTLEGKPLDGSASLDDFYTHLRAGSPATTSQPSPGDFADAYARAAARGANAIVSIHLDGRTSGTVASAELAAAEASVPVTVVDTRTASFGVAVCVRAAVRKAASGESPSSIAATVGRLGVSLRNLFVVRGSQRGRITVDGGWSLLTFAGGVTTKLTEYGAVEEAVSAIVERTREDKRPIRAAVGHAAAEVEGPADELAHRLGAEPGILGVERYRVGAPVGAHTGPDSFGIFWWPAG